MRHKQDLQRKYPPSEPCSCEVCLSYCQRPGWWTVKEAASALEAGLGPRMMLELSPDHSFGVLSPAFYGCEGFFGFNEYAPRGCNFLKNGLCELHGSGRQPLECRFCHHDRVGLGPRCHADLEKDWNTPAGQALVTRWTRQMGLWDELERYGLGSLKAKLD
ncbi:MAG TPA: hypothetical protein VMT46_13195 [Anaerolineaceae bacterium]|nr:hypothetical protein [Anaerolineaceae bacterium]